MLETEINRNLLDKEIICVVRYWVALERDVKTFKKYLFEKLYNNLNEDLIKDFSHSYVRIKFIAIDNILNWKSIYNAIRGSI